jgi:hypothetical protein
VCKKKKIKKKKKKKTTTSRYRRNIVRMRGRRGRDLFLSRLIDAHASSVLHAIACAAIPLPRAFSNQQ